MSRKLERFTLLLVPFRSNIHPKSPELAREKNSKSPSLSNVRSKSIKIDVCPGGDLQRFYPSDQTHNQTNLIEPDVELFMNVTH